MRNVYTFLIVFLVVVISHTEAHAVDPAPGNMRFTWIHGSLSAKANTDVRIQVHRYNENTYVLRQNPAVHWEAPFMYLLMGDRRAILLDAGATASEEYFPLRQVVDRVLARWRDANQLDLQELVVLPLGSDASQIGALAQFENRAATQIIPFQGAARTRALDLSEGFGTLELGNRTLTVVASPGLNPDSVAIYDPSTQALFTGNTLYPGRLVIRDFAAYHESLARLIEVSQSNPVHSIWGGRIEMTNQPGLDYILRTNYRPNERALQLPSSALAEAAGIVKLINGRSDIHIHDDFIVMHGVGRGARAYGWPVYIPEQFRTRNTR